jgi:hypothetical protein
MFHGLNPQTVALRPNRNRACSARMNAGIHEKGGAVYKINNKDKFTGASSFPSLPRPVPVACRRCACQGAGRRFYEAEWLKMMRQPSGNFRRFIVEVPMTSVWRGVYSRAHQMTTAARSGWSNFTSTRVVET